MLLHSNETRPSRICCSDHLKVVALRLTEEQTELYKYIFFGLKKIEFFLTAGAAVQANLLWDYFNQQVQLWKCWCDTHTVGVKLWDLEKTVDGERYLLEINYSWISLIRLSWRHSRTHPSLILEQHAHIDNESLNQSEVEPLRSGMMNWLLWKNQKGHFAICSVITQVPKHTKTCCMLFNHLNLIALQRNTAV